MMLSDMVPDGAILRLTDHYGQEVRTWLDNVHQVVSRAASRWGIRLSGFHDAGWASVVALGIDPAGRSVVLKAHPDRNRYLLERTALAQWAGGGVCWLLEADDDDQILLIKTVGDAAGGSPQPDDHECRVAAAIPELHRTYPDVGGIVPSLTDYYRDTVMPRIAHRGRAFSSEVGRDRADHVLRICRSLSEAACVNRMLHSDLYAENVLFDHAGRPVFIDPLPKIGPPAFDWAFWCVYYKPTSGFADRVALCREHVPEYVEEVLAWAATLAVDGALYYLDSGDDTALSMLDILDSPALSRVLGTR